MKTVLWSALTILAMMLFATCACAAPGGRSIEVSGALGVSNVDLDAWEQTDQYGSSLVDWSKFLQGFHVQVYPFPGRVQVGAEVGYEYNFWYTVKPYAFSARDVSYEPIHFLAMVRANLGGGLFAEVGGGMFSSEPGGIAGLGYRIPLSPKIGLPVKVRAALVTTDPSVIPITGSVGLSVGF